jgi:transcriptional regulator with XRE-family HTH domain
MARKPPGPKAAGLGAELRAIRKRLKLSMAEVAGRLGWSESLVSRLETGNRNINIEEVSALLAIYGATGTERDRLMAMARTPDESSWLDTDLPGLPAESVKLATYEADAIKVTDWALGLMPGLLQSMDYTRAYMLSDGIPEAEIGSRLMARQRRQEILRRVEYTAFIDEGVLQRPIGGPRVLARQISHLVELAEDSAATIRITPGNTDGHAGLISPFVLLEFQHSAPIVHVELARSGAFLSGRSDTAIYPETVNRLDSLSLDVEQSLRLLRTAAGAIEGET